MSNQPIVRCALLVALSFALGACISVNLGGDPPPATVFKLQADEAQTKSRTQTKGDTVVAVSKPEVPPALATERIALSLEDGRRVDYYADAKWPGKLDDVLQEFVIDRAQQQLPRAVVDKPEAASSADFRLDIKVTSFEPVYKGAPDTAPRLDVAMTVTVIDVPEGRVRSQFTVRKSAQASENRLTPITSELGKLLQAAVDEAVARAAPQLAAA
jgi:ABC-type uncharacterized transport system auxiliary subunit